MCALGFIQSTEGNMVQRVISNLMLWLIQSLCSMRLMICKSFTHGNPSKCFSFWLSNLLIFWVVVLNLCYFSPFGEDSNFDPYVLIMGLKPPTCILLMFHCMFSQCLTHHMVPRHQQVSMARPPSSLCGWRRIWYPPWGGYFRSMTRATQGWMLWMLSVVSCSSVGQCWQHHPLLLGFIL